MNGLRSFMVHDGAVVIRNARGEISWKGHPDGLPARDVVAMPDGSASFVLLELPPTSVGVSNLVKISGGGTILWRAQTPEGGPADVFVDLHLPADGQLTARTWSGYQLTIDPDDGRILRAVFTK